VTRVATVAAALALAAAVSVSAQQTPREDYTEYLPPGGPGRALVAEQCATGHDLGGIVRMRKSKADWEAVILDMVGRGAALVVDDVDPMVAYLAEAFGPAVPPFTDVNSAGAEELVRLPGVRPESAERFVAARKGKGPYTSHEQVRTALGLTERGYEPIKRFVYFKTPSAR
jgi:hypothetical protein